MKLHNFSQFAYSAFLIVVFAAPISTRAASDKPADRISIYPHGAAVVADSQSAQLDRGANTIDWIATGRVDPATFWLSGQGVTLRGLTGEPRETSSPDPLTARIGQSVTLRNIQQTAAGRETHERRQGTLIGVSNGDAFVRVGKRVVRVTQSSPWQLSWPAADARTPPRNRPDSLKLSVHASAAGQKKLEATYQIAGLVWRASTTGHFDADDTTLTFHSMALIDNHSDRPVNASKAALIAGDVNRANGQRPRPMVMATKRQADSGAGSPQAIGHGYRYALDRGLRLVSGQTRAVSLIDRRQVSAQRRFVVENRFNARTHDDDFQHARVQLTFKNEGNKPLPAGAFRVYSSAHKATLIGADQIGNTPAGALLHLDLGRAFDVTSTRHIVSDARTSDGANQRVVKVTVRNAGQQSAPVELTEQLPEHATIVSASASQSADDDAHRTSWQLKVPAGGEQTLRYTVRWPKK